MSGGGTGARGTSERKVTLTSDGVASGRAARRITARASGTRESEPIRPALALEPVPQFLGRAGAGDPGSETLDRIKAARLLDPDRAPWKDWFASDLDQNP